MKDVREIMEINVDNLKQRQFNIYKEFVLKTLKGIIEDIELNNFNNVYDKLFYSPSGDECGMDNYCIDFSYDERDVDIREAIDLLERLK